MSSPHYHDSIDVHAGSAPSPDAGAEFLGRAASVHRVRIAFALIGVGAVLLLVRASDLQIRSGSAYTRAAATNHLRVSLLVPERGRILDRNGIVLTQRATQYAIGIVPSMLPTGTRRSDTLVIIAAAIGGTGDELTTIIDAYPPSTAEPVVVREHLAHPDALRILTASAGVPAVRMLTDVERQYVGVNGRPLESISHITGYLSRITADQYATRAGDRYRPSDRIGTTGVEAHEESALRGTPGTQEATVDASGRVVAVAAREQPQAGNDVRLTIDAVLQESVERSLRRGVAAAGARRGAAVVLDPTSGDILALVSLPMFSATAMSRGLTTNEATSLFGSADQPLFHRAIAGTYPSGSTIKPIVAAAALSQGVATARTRVLSTGGIAVEGSFFPDWREGGHGWVTVREAIAQSVNTFFYLIGGGKPRAASANMPGPTQEQALGPERLADALRTFGLGTPTGIDLPGEASGLVPDPTWKKRERNQDWYIGDTYHLAIGQGDILVTPLQMAVATAAFANRGYRVQPHVVLSDFSPSRRPRIREPLAREEGELEACPPACDSASLRRGVENEKSQISNLKSQIPGLTPDALTAIRTAMRAAVTEGSAAALNVFPFPTYGKTGTAEHGKGKKPHAWFVGFAERPPIENHQSKIENFVVVVVLIEDGGEGSRTAVPVAREIISAWAANVSIPTTDP